MLMLNAKYTHFWEVIQSSYPAGGEVAGWKITFLIVVIRFYLE